MNKKPIVKNPYLRVLIYIPVCIFIYLCSAIILTILHLLITGELPGDPAEKPFHMTFFLEMATIITSLILITFTLLFWKYFDRKKLASFGLGINPRLILGFLFGGLLSAVVLGAAFAVNYCLKNFRIAAFNFEGDSIKTVPFLAYYLFFFFCAGLFEEVLMRGYCLQTLAERGRIIMAIAVSSFLFSIFHIANFQFAAVDNLIILVSAFNIFLVGAVFSLQFLISGSLWLPVGFHVFWNFFMNSILSIPVSGVRLKTLFDVRIAPGNELLTGGAFGLEGSILVTFMLAILLAVHAVIYFMGGRSAQVGSENAPDREEKKSQFAQVIHETDIPQEISPLKPIDGEWET